VEIFWGHPVHHETVRGLDAGRLPSLSPSPVRQRHSSSPRSPTPLSPSPVRPPPEFVTRQQSRGDVTYWRCCVRSNVADCRATVIERNGVFSAGSRPHNHGAVASDHVVRAVKVAVREQAAANLFEPASSVVDRIVERVDIDRPLQHMPSTANLARAANHCRRRQRPDDPQDLTFILDMTNIPENFFVADVRVDSQRHIAFATPQMLHLLSSATHWYVDGTFKVVKQPFTQLLSVHCFVQRDQAVKQVPLLFVCMSARRKRDYRAVFRAVLRHMPSAPAVTTVVSDFEAALWRALPHVLGSHVEHRGCTFHWTQAVWRKLQASTYAA
jgi:MULE transposase domain